MDIENRDEILYSFTQGDQETPIDFGIDTTTEEGRKQFKADFDILCAMTPELLKPENMLYPHEMPKLLS